jgi:hypothetical protein
VSHSKNREIIFQRLRADVLGPEAYDDSEVSNEILRLRDPVSPQYHYVIGHIHPQFWGQRDPENTATASVIKPVKEISREDGEEAEDSEIEPPSMDEDEEEVKSRSTLQNPSSIGITCCFGDDIEDSFNIIFQFSRYTSIEFQMDSKIRSWRRSPYSMSETILPRNLLSKTQKYISKECPWVELSVSSRRSRIDNKIRVTTTVTNTFEFDEPTEISLLSSNRLD